MSPHDISRTINLNSLKAQLVKTAELIWLLARCFIRLTLQLVLLAILVLGLMWLFVAAPWFFNKLFHVMELGMRWVVEHLFAPFLQ